VACAKASEKKELKFISLRVIAIIALFISLIFLVPNLVYPKVHFGQLGKQTFAAQMIQSTARGELSHGVFPTRHFVEVYEDGLVPWAEEVPLYSFMSAGLVNAFGITPIAAGKVWSFISFFLILFGFARIARALKKPVWIFVMLAAIYPVFRLYSVQVMPDLCMTAALVWMIEAALVENIAGVAILLLIASLFKYYAVFTGFGLGLYYLYRKNWRAVFYLTLAIIPCIAYILWFLKLGIPNPIVDSIVADGHGHLSSFANILSAKDWARVGLWWFVKNASIPGAILAVMGATYTFKNEKSLRPFFVCLCIGLITFPALFISSFYVHDYYGLQGSIGIAIFAALGLSFVFEKNKWAGIASVALVLGFSVMIVNSMAKVEPDYDVIESAVEKLAIPKDGFIISVSGISKPVLSYHLGYDAYIIGVDEWTRPNVQARIADPRFHYAFIHSFKYFEGMNASIRADLTRLGFKPMDLKLDLSNTQFEIWKK
jgi:hypothetical protein